MVSRNQMDLAVLSIIFLLAMPVLRKEYSLHVISVTVDAKISHLANKNFAKHLHLNAGYSTI